ncbi:hypothetical protein E3U43_006688 [Larimichthys crocea]|uniref:Uncharacterized protein n=1 Tax=Larimichthys crocea TaxID=215358 RepID=A0ACD3RLE1_LARCR|nr:hypothetical protein E3U43_006688 [Larimichthys crocea]
MKSERKAALLAITENIEMKLFSSEESCVVIPAQEKDEKYSFDQRRLEHPLVADCDEEPELQDPDQTQTAGQTQNRASCKGRGQALLPCPRIHGRNSNRNGGVSSTQKCLRVS